MPSSVSRRGRRRARGHAAVALAASAVAVLSAAATYAQRVTGIDVADWQGDLSQATWNNVKGGTHPTGGRSFAFIRSSRGGTTGFYNQSDAWNELRRNTLSQRYDDRYLENNAQRAVNAGLYVGPYHFGRMDVWTNAGSNTTKLGDSQQAQTPRNLNTAWFNYGDIANDGADEARHFLQQAGPWMKPGYLLPTFDYEAGEIQRTAAQNSAFAVAFSNQISAAKGVQPIVYIGQNYAMDEANSTVPAVMPNNWVARWPNNDNPELVDIQNTDPPGTGGNNIYGQWHPAGAPYPTPQPWKFWQYGSSNTNVAGISPVDVDVAHGDIEFLKEMLVPALWTKTNATSTGLWSDVHNWNSDADPSGKGPAARLPGAAPTLGVVDTVVLDSAGYSNAITFDATAGTQQVRKLVVRNETLNITGGTLDVIYSHVAPRAIDFGPQPWSVLVDGTVNLSGAGKLTAPRIDVAAGRTLNLNGGTLAFNALNLLGTGTIAIGGNVTLGSRSGGVGTISTANSGTMINLGGATRTLTVDADTASNEIVVAVPFDNGGLTKAGSGAIRLTANNSTFLGPVTVNSGALILSGAAGALTWASSYAVHTGGTLTLDNAGNVNANRIGQNPFAMHGGTLSIIGDASTAVFETAGPFTAASGASTVSHGANAPKLLFGAYARSPGATVNFASAGAANQVSFTAGVTSGSFIDQGAFVGGGDYAVYDAGNYVRAMTIGAGAHDYSSTVVANRHVKTVANASIAVPTTINTLNLAGATVGFTMSPGANLTLTHGGVVKGSGGASAISGAANLVTGASTEYVFNTINGADVLTVSAAVTGGSGLTKTGAGTLALSNGGNSYGGATTVARGTLRLGAADAIPDASNLTVAGGATFNVNGFTDTIGNVTLNDGHISGAGTITLGGAGNSVTYGGRASGSTIATAMALGTDAGTTTFVVADGAVQSDLHVSGVLSNGGGTRNLVKSGPGTLQLAGANSFTGGVTVAEGTLAVASIDATATANQPLGNNTGAINVGSMSPATLQYNGAAAATLNRPIIVAGPGGATVRATSGALTLGAGVFGGGNPFTLDAAGGNITVAGTINGAGTVLTKTGPGVARLTAASNSHGGGTAINQGVLEYSNPNQLGSAGGVTFGGGGGGAGGTLRALASFSDPWTLNFAGAGAIDTNGFNVEYTNVTFGPGSLTKTGAGTLTLTNANAHTGMTIVNAGTLHLGGSLHASSRVVIHAGGTLAGGGTVNGSAFVYNGGAINLANGTIAGSLTANGGTWGGAGTVNGGVNVNTYNAVFNLNGTLTVPAAQALNVDAGTLAGAGTLGGNATLTNAGAINFSTASAHVTGTLTVGAGGGEWRGTGAVDGNVTVTHDAFGVTGNVALNPPSFTSATLGGAGTLTMNAGTTLWGWGTIGRSVILNNNVRLVGTPARGALKINAPITWGASGLQIYGGTVETQGDTITGSLQISGTARGQLAGSGAAVIDGGIVTIRGAGDIAKPVVLSNGGTLSFISYIDKDTGPIPDTGGAGDTTYFGTISNSLTVNGTGGNWSGRATVTGAVGVTAGNFALAPGSALSAPGGLTVSGTGSMTGSSSATVTGNVTYTSSAAHTWAGVITGAGNAVVVDHVNANVTFMGLNSYGGGTQITSGVLTLLGPAQAGSGAITTGAGGTLRLAGGVTGALPLTIGGAGNAGAIATAPGGQGALSNSGGNNTWAGSITLNGTGSNAGDAALNQIGGAAAGALTITGTIQGGLGQTWAKTGDGDVVLAGASPNTFTGLTRVLGGRLIVEKPGALGSAGAAAAGTGNTFQITNSASSVAFRSASSLNYSTFEVINTEGTGAPGFGQVDNLGGDNTFAGQIAFGGPSVGGAIQSSIGVSDGSLHVQGGLFARSSGNVPRNINKLGAGTLILSSNGGASTGNPLVTPLQNSTMNVTAGAVELHAPSLATTNLPGVTTWNVGGGASVNLASGVLGTAALNVSGGGVNVAAGAGKAIAVDTVSVTDGGRIDLGTGDMVIRATPLGAATPDGNGLGTYGGVQGLIQSAKTIDGTWDGPGIATSAANAINGGTETLGAAIAGEVIGFDGPTALWNGLTLSPSDVVIMYTYAGDANLDGTVDGGDYAFIDAFVGSATADVAYYKGDFNYDGAIDGGDYAYIDVNVGRAGSLDAPAAADATPVSAVPEPAGTLGAALAGAAGLLRRRRRAR